MLPYQFTNYLGHRKNIKGVKPVLQSNIILLTEPRKKTLQTLPNVSTIVFIYFEKKTIANQKQPYYTRLEKLYVMSHF